MESHHLLLASGITTGSLREKILVCVLDRGMKSAKVIAASIGSYPHRDTGVLVQCGIKDVKAAISKINAITSHCRWNQKLVATKSGDDYLITLEKR